MMRWLQRGVPLPLGAIHNQRSLVALDNLVDLIVTCLTHPAAANQTFLVSDGEDVSTTGAAAPHGPGHESPGAPDSGAGRLAETGGCAGWASGTWPSACAVPCRWILKKRASF